MADVRIIDGNVKLSMTGTEEWPCSGSGNPTLTGNLLAQFLGGPLDWTPTHTGFSSNPTFTGRYLLIGKMLFLSYTCSASGTSNATSYTLSLPASLTGRSGRNQFCFGGNVVNNGSSVSQSARVLLASNGSTISLSPDPIGNNWTAANGKSMSFSGWFEVN